MSLRNPSTLGVWGSCGTRVVAVPSYWKQPLKWNKAAAEDIENALHDFGSDTYVAPERPRVFCASLADVFEDWKGNMHFPDKDAIERVSYAWWSNRRGVVKGKPNALVMCGERLATMDDVRLALFETIRQTPNLDWLLLTKRPQNWSRCIEGVLKLIEGLPDWGTTGKHRLEPLRDWLADWFVLRQPPHNVWIGTTVEDQTRADERIPALLEIPARVRFLSCEPLLGPVDFREVPALMKAFNSTPYGWHNWLKQRIHWVIAGGESGHGARPMHPDWARSLRDQCAAAGVPFLFKQWGEFGPNVTGESPFEEQSVRNAVCHICERGERLYRVGKKRAGRLLDGREHNEFPTP